MWVFKNSSISVFFFVLLASSVTMIAQQLSENI